MHFQHSLEFARQLDERDGTVSFREEFVIPEHKGKQALYFLGNSLGLRPKRTTAYIEQVIQQWDTLGVEGFFMGKQPWLHYHDQLIQPLAAVVGALPHEIVVMNSLTVNLHLMLASFYQPVGKRTKILCEAKAFCSDQYMLETHIRQRGFDPDAVLIEVHPRPNEYTIREEDLLATMEQHADELALVFIGGVNYYTGQVFHMQVITEAAHKAGAKAGFDLAHAAGNVVLNLHDWNVDFACWCSYKYLNSGPGGIGGAFIHERYHQDRSLDRLAGWWGYNKATRFKMEKGFDPTPTAEGWQLSTPSPVLYASLKASLEIFAMTDMKTLQEKGRALSDFLLFLLAKINSSLPQKMIQVLTPESEKGCQVSLLMLQKGKEIFNDLSEAGVFADWREPDVIRVAPVPLYNTFEEVWQFGQFLQKACKNHF